MSLLFISFNFYTVLFIIGIVLVIFSVILYIKTNRLFQQMEKNYTPCVATIIDTKEGKNKAYAAVYSYTFEGVPYEVTGPYVSLTPYKIGATVDIKINTNDPQKNSINMKRLRSIALSPAKTGFAIGILLVFIGYNCMK